MHPETDIAVIGAGVVGLAIAYTLADRFPRHTIAVLDKHGTFGQEISSRNSEVLHAGIYYPPAYLKSRLCLTGQQAVYDFCQHYQVPHRQLGKYIVAWRRDQLDRLYRLYENGIQKGLPLELVSGRRLGQIEPLIYAYEAVYSPTTGIVDAHALMSRLYYLARQQGITFLWGSEVQDIEYTGGLYRITTPLESFSARILINSAGLGSAPIAAMLKMTPTPSGDRVYLCKGEYFRLKRQLPIRHLIYPVPEKNWLGIHLTPDMAGGLRVGPNAFYVTDCEYTVDAEHRDLFYEAVRPFFPSLKAEWLVPDFAGVRPRLQGPEDAGPRDFIIREESVRGYPGFINLLGIESPGLTSSLGIAGYIRQWINL